MLNRKAQRSKGENIIQPGSSMPPTTVGNTLDNNQNHAVKNSTSALAGFSVRRLVVIGVSVGLVGFMGNVIYGRYIIGRNDEKASTTTFSVDLSQAETTGDGISCKNKDTGEEEIGIACQQ